ncbi:MAG: DUF3857 domain-containing protein [Bryobacteraceae bacterium]
MKTPMVEKDAGVEALFWRVHLRDEVMGGRDIRRVFYHYVRLKVFDEKGKEKASTIDLESHEKTAIADVVGRTIKPDGTELKLKPDSVFERDLVRAGRLRTKVKAFAMPGVEPGSIIEYRWKEILSDSHIMYTRLQFQREYPVQKVTYFIQPLPQKYTEYQMMSAPFNCTPTPLKPESDGFWSTTLENVPAFRREPMMPGEASVRPWLLLIYRQNVKAQEPEKYWQASGKEIYRDHLKTALKPNDDVRRAAADAVEGAATDEQKVAALVRYIRNNLKDLFGSQVTEAERARILKEMPQSRLRTSSEVLKSGVGTANELNTLFASMASSVGLEARPALVADSEDIVFVPEMTDRYFLPHIDMAVQISGTWKLYDVSTRLLPSNMISWREEGMKALVSDPKNPVFIDTPNSPPDVSGLVRSAKLNLSEDGTLEGEIRQQFSGHAAADRRSEFSGEAPERREESVKEELTKNFRDAEVTDVRVENADDPEQPVQIAYHVRIAGYAARTGKRLLLQPLFFQRGMPPLFAAAERRYRVQVPYAWRESDTVSITVPAGYTLDNAEAPHSLNMGTPGSYEVKVVLTGGRELVCTRNLTFGRGGALAYTVQQYPKLKAAFDSIHQRDEFTIALKAPAESGSR